jgi:CRP-like cAMP-binding protein
VLCSLRPHLATLFLTAMAARLRQATEAARDRGMRDVPSRLAAWLLARMEPSGTGGGTVALRQHKRVLAAELGTSPETFSRALSRLRLLGLVAVRGYTVSVLDREGLQRIAGRLPGSSAGPAASSPGT